MVLAPVPFLFLLVHWDNAYKKNSSKNLGWFESDPKLSIELIEKCNLNKDSVLFNAGAAFPSATSAAAEHPYLRNM